MKYCNSHNINLEKLNIHPYKDVNEFLISNKEELSKRIKSIASIPDARSNSFDILANKEKRSYLSTGINTLDSALGGGIIADLYCLGGVPGAGKSAFMLQLASSLSAKGQHVLYVSLELSASEIDARNASRLSFSRNKENYLTALEINSGNVTEDKKGIFQAIKEEYQTTFQNFLDHYIMPNHKGYYSPSKQTQNDYRGITCYHGGLHSTNKRGRCQNRKTGN